MRIPAWMPALILLPLICGCGSAVRHAPVSHLPPGDSSTLPDADHYTIQRWSEDGQLVDSLPHGTAFLHHIRTDHPQPFPSGWACLQQPLEDSVWRICERITSVCTEWGITDSAADEYGCLRETKLIPRFRETAGESVFTEENTRSCYFFLTEMADTNLYFQDTQYGLLHFLKWYSHRGGPGFQVKNGQASYVNRCQYREIIWDKPMEVRWLKKKRFETVTFRRWKEFWECGQKHDYAPVYPYVNLPPIPRDTSVSGYDPDIFTLILEPVCAFSYVCMQPEKDILKNLHPVQKQMQLVTEEGRVVKGEGIDFTGDGHAEVFWFHQFTPTPAPERYTLLFLKIGKQWTPVYYTHQNEFMGFGSYAE